MYYLVINKQTHANYKFWKFRLARPSVLRRIDHNETRNGYYMLAFSSAKTKRTTSNYKLLLILSL